MVRSELVAGSENQYQGEARIDPFPRFGGAQTVFRIAEWIQQTSHMQSMWAKGNQVMNSTTHLKFRKILDHVREGGRK